MDLQSELEVYQYLQLLNDKNSSEGTNVFVSYLFDKGKLDYVLSLFNHEIKINRNEDLAYLFALETILENFGEKLEALIRNLDKPKAEDYARDIENNAKNLIQKFDELARVNIDENNLISTFETISKILHKCIELIKDLDAYANDTRLRTNLPVDGKEFIKHIKDIRLTNRSSGYYFYFE